MMCVFGDERMAAIAVQSQILGCTNIHTAPTLQHSVKLRVWVHSALTAGSI